MTNTGDPEPGPAMRAMRYQHQLCDTPLYDNVLGTDGGAYHAVPRRRTRCGIPIGRYDNPNTDGAPPCPACHDLERDLGNEASAEY